MFRMWGKIMKDNHLVKDMVACCGDYSISRTQMVFNCLDEICYKFDLEKPMWLDATVLILNITTKPGLPRIILLRLWILII